MRRRPATAATIRIFGNWTPPRCLRRVKPSDMKLTAEQDSRCARCGVWPDQNVGVTGDWLIAPTRLCPSCHARVEFNAVRSRVELEKAATRWPPRGAPRNYRAWLGQVEAARLAVNGSDISALHVSDETRMLFEDWSRGELTDEDLIAFASGETFNV